MRECIEARLSMIGTHPGVSHSSEREVLIAEVHDGLIDAASSKGYLRQDFPDIPAIP